MTIYFLSGLGADSRAFKFLNFPKNAKLIFIDWIDPLPNEDLRSYAKRISKKIDTSKPFYLVGLSFGGILATEVLEFVTPKKTIIISSVASRQELPYLFKLAGMVRIHKLTPSKLFNRPSSITNWFFGVKTLNEKKLLSEIITSSNTLFSKWAVDQILVWKRRIAPKNIVRVCGENDKVLPPSRNKCKYLIKNGGHFMVVTHAIEISEILQKEMAGG